MLLGCCKEKSNFCAAFCRIMTSRCSAGEIGTSVYSQWMVFARRSLSVWAEIMLLRLGD